MLAEEGGFAYSWRFEDSVDRACELLGLVDSEAAPAEEWPSWTDDFSWEITDPDLEWFPCEPCSYQSASEGWTELAATFSRSETIGLDFCY